MAQPGLFDGGTEATTLERALLFALGDFQSRKKVLADRELALDRLRGAFLRAFARFEISEPSDEAVAAALERLGAHIKRVPSFVAKHPFRITVPHAMARAAAEIFENASRESAVPERDQ